MDDFKRVLWDIKHTNNEPSLIKTDYAVYKTSCDEAEYARFPRDNYGYLITINNYGDHPLDSFGIIKGFL